MRYVILGFLMMVSVCGAQDSAKGTLLRVSGGEGLGQFGFVVEGRVLGGVEGSPWRYGAQLMGMMALNLFSTPSETVSSLCFLVGKEFVPTGPMSFTLFGGAGFAESELYGDKVSSGYFNTTYDMEKSTDPALLLGGDLSVSIKRHLGVSLQFGILASAIATTYTVLQVDVGSW